jgi:MoaA/NifB/PqqE/SkfB family radical SAM enzyme
MKDFVQRIRIILFELARSPLKASAEIGRRLLNNLFVTKQVSLLQQITHQTPLILQIETTNTCNAACVFCAKSHMKREKGVMGMPLFEKIMHDYAYMGGGPVSLTPVIGDALLDPHLLERLQILKSHPKINQISLTTNAIALDRYSDEEVCRLLETLYCIQVSIGGLDAETYRTMFGVDLFSRVQQAMERLSRLNGTVSEPAHITFAFRTNDWKFESRYKQLLEEYQRRDIYINHIWTYANYSGNIKSDKYLNLVVMKSCLKKRRSCFYPGVAMSICWDGVVTACGCADFEGNRLMMGNVEKDDLSALWAGEKRAGILGAFETGKLPTICRQCSAYQPDSIFSHSCFKDVKPHQPLPLKFYHEFWGG